MRTYRNIRKITLAIIAILLLMAFTFPTESFDNSYYFRGEKVELVTKSDIIFVQFENNIELNSVENILNDFPSFSLTYDYNENVTNYFLKSQNKIAENELLSVMSSLSEKSGVTNVSPAFGVIEGTGNPNVVIGLTREVIAQFKADYTEDECVKYVASVNGTVVKKMSLRGGNTYLITIPEGKYCTNFANELFESGNFNYVSPNLCSHGLMMSGVTTNDTYFPYQWAINNTGDNIPTSETGTVGCDLNADSAWNFTMGDPSVIISIVDSGVDSAHADLSGNWIEGISLDATDDGYNTPTDLIGHGTCCAGIIAATANNELYTAGIAPESRIFAVRIFDAIGSTTNEAISSGLTYAWEMGSWISSNSWGGGAPADVIENAIIDGVTYGRNGRGVVWTFATGNDNISTVSYPAAYEHVIAVGGISPCEERTSPTSCDGEAWWGANYGNGLTVVAPAVHIYTSDISGNFGYSVIDVFRDFNGTSSATPNVAGVCGLMLAADSLLEWKEVREIIAKTADKIGDYDYDSDGYLGYGGWNNEMGYGKANAFSAVEYVIANRGPAIAHTPHKLSENLNGPYTINAEITDEELLIENSIKMFYGYDEEGISDSVVMTNSGNNIYTADIPGTGNEGTVNYYITATDELNRKRSLPAYAPDEFYSFSVTTDNEAPVIVHTALENMNVLRFPPVISAEVTDLFDIVSTQVEYRINGGATSTFDIFHYDEDIYQGSFPNIAVNENDVIEYRIISTDNSNQSNTGYAPQTGYYSFSLRELKGKVLLVNDDTEEKNRASAERGLPGDINTPLGASQVEMQNTLETAGYYTDVVAYNDIDTTLFNDYHIIFLSAGTKGLSIFNDSEVRAALVEFTLNGGKTLVEGGDVGYYFRKTNSADRDSSFRKNILHIVGWTDDYIGQDIVVTESSHPLFNIPNTMAGTLEITETSSLNFGASDALTLAEENGVRGIAKYGSSNNEGSAIIVYHEGNDTSQVRNIFFPFAISLIKSDEVRADLLVNAAAQLMKGVVLPVELTSFNADINSNGVLLNWSTATETNNMGFDIERKQKGTHYRKISFVKGKGTTTEITNYSAVDATVESGDYTYRLKQYDYNGSYSYSNEINITVELTPEQFELSNNFPNPFNPTTKIQYSIPIDTRVKLTVFNILGEQVATLVNKLQPAGKYEVEFNGSNLSSGIYLYRLEADSYSAIKKLVLLK